MQGRRSATARQPRPRTSARAEPMTGRQRRRELIEIMAAGVERAIAERTCPPSGDAGFSADSPVYGLELSDPEASLSQRLRPEQNEIKDGERQ